jgi:prepilin-type N-terminal cleavage/methylation domain-containing protein
MKRNFGFSLTELMMSLGILSVLLMMGTGVMSYMSKSMSTADKMSDINQLTNELQDIMSSPILCTKVVAGVPPSEQQSLVISEKIRAHAKYTKNIEIIEVKLMNIQKVKDEYYRAQVRVRGKKLGTFLGSGEFVRDAVFFYQSKTNTSISSCVGEASNPRTSCGSLGGVWDDLYSRCDFCSSLGGEKVANICRLKPKDLSGTECPITKTFSDEDCGWSSRAAAVAFVTDLTATASFVSSAEIQEMRTSLLKLMLNPEDPRCKQASGADIICNWSGRHGVLGFGAAGARTQTQCANSITVEVSCPAQ